MIIFKSTNRRHKTLTDNPPTILKLINKFTLSINKKGENVRIPKLPNFNKIAARIIDPKTGASTWALGSHRWTLYMGSLTKKAVMRHTINNFIVEELFKNNKNSV